MPQIWRRVKRRGRYLRGFWKIELTLESPINPKATAKARMQRRSAKPSTISQLTWTKDDRKAAPDCPP